MTRFWQATLGASVAAATMMAASGAWAQARAYDIPAQPAISALPEFGRQAGVQIVAPAETLRGVRTPSLRGRYERADALALLIRSMDLEVASDDGTTVVLRRRVAGTAPTGSAALEPTYQIEEVIVTAQRRPEEIGRTPVAVTVVSGSRIAESGITSISALENLTPSLTLNQGGQAASGGFRIRGIGTETFSAGVEPAVATFVDGVLIGRTTNVTSLQLVDVDRVEVLRGPQGTLFGKNASSGVVNIVTRNPTRDFETGVVATVAERNEYNIQGWVSGPVSDQLSLRLAGFVAGHDGHVRNTVPDATSLWAPLVAAQPNLLNGLPLYKGDSFYALEAFGLRGKLRYDGETLTSQLTAEYAQSESDCCARTFIEIYGPGTGTDRRLFGADVGRQSDETAADAYQPTTDESLALIWDNTLRLGAGYELVSVSGYRNQLNETVEDQDYGAGPELGLPAFFDKAEFDYRRSRTEQLSQEFRLNSPLNVPAPIGTFDYVLGVYAFHQVDDFGPGNRRVLIINNTSPTRIAGCSTPVCRRDFVYNVKLTSSNTAAFGQVNWHLDDRLTVFYGGRLTRDEIEYDWSSQDDPFAPFRQGTFRRQEKGSETDFSSRVGVEYEAGANAFFYASYAQGYKGPGFRTFERIGFEELLNPERADAYEVGTRLRFPGIRSYVGLTLYRQDYRDLVVSGYDQVLRITRNFNAAEARAQGVEIDFNARPIEGLYLTGGIALSDNEYTDFPGTGCYPFQTAAQGCVFDAAANRNLQDLEGAPLQRAPEVKGVFSARYDMPVSIGRVRPFIQGDYRWFSEQQYGGNNDPKTLQEAYGVLDLAAGVMSEDRRFEFKVFAKNALDDFYAVNIFSTDNWLNQRIPRDYQRYFGATLSARY